MMVLRVHLRLYYYGAMLFVAGMIIYMERQLLWLRYPRPYVDDTSGHHDTAGTKYMEEMINNSSYTSCTARYLRQHRADLYQLDKMKTKHGNNWREHIKTGLRVPGSKIGFYAADAGSYEVFEEQMKYMVWCHNGRDADPAAIPQRVVGGDQLDLQVSDACKKRIVSVRCRFARNLSKYTFPTSILPQERLAAEAELMSAFSKLTGDLAGSYTRMSDIPLDKQEIMVKNHQLFHNHDEFLEKGDFFRDWPNGRGVFMNNDQTVMVWVGEEDHIRCMSLEKGFNVSSCYNKATRMLEHLDKHVGLAHHKDFGWLTSCPTNVGTGMRASVHISLPRLKKHKSIDEIKAFCKSKDIDIRGIGGENTGWEGDVFDISNRRRFDVACKDAITDVINGLNLLMEWEESFPEA